MRIAFVVAGAGDMYCGACHRDAELLRSLGKVGQDMLAIPLYTPLRTDLPLAVGSSPMFLGGINLFLDQAIGAFRILPASWRRQLDRPGLLRRVARFGMRTAPARLGPMTVGMLRGLDGPHAAEIRRLVEFLRDSFRPDIVHLSNSLLASLAPPIKAVLGVPVVCTLQGEESFLEGLPEPFRSDAFRLWREKAEPIDRFVSCCAERVPVLADALHAPAERFRIVPTGIDARPFALRGHRATSSASGPFRVGYLSSIRPEKGLDLLVEALRQMLVEAHADVHLHVAGQVLDREFWRRVRDTIARADLASRVTYHGAPDLPGKVSFLQACDVFVMPTRLPESRAVAAMEALAAGVPVVAMGRGVLPELLATTGGGVTVAPDDPSAMARAILDLLRDPERRASMSESARAAIAEHYSPALMASRTIAVYDALLGARPTT